MRCSPVVVEDVWPQRPGETADRLHLASSHLAAPQDLLPLAWHFEWAGFVAVVRLLGPDSGWP